MGVVVCACNYTSNAPSEVGVDKDVIVAIYSTIDKDGLVDTVSPCLMKETVHISELLHYPNDKGVTMPFNLSDTTKYAEMTASNLNKRIAISVNGEVMATPVVKMELTNGACSVVLNDAQIADLFPNVDMKQLKEN
ncbi:MAG: hypothetical protein K2H96_08225 [Muribaculaceae bacterium]|nr:hypothetical protein [Muribaculaceae bacterium]